MVWICVGLGRSARGVEPRGRDESPRHQALLARLMDENAKLARPLDATEVMREAVIRSALDSAAQAVEWGLPAEKIVISCKMSQVQDLIAVYRSLASRCDFALHLGLTEAGMGSKGIVASSAALAVLLQEKPLQGTLQVQFVLRHSRPRPTSD